MLPAERGDPDVVDGNRRACSPQLAPDGRVVAGRLAINIQDRAAVQHSLQRIDCAMA